LGETAPADEQGKNLQEALGRDALIRDPGADVAAPRAEASGRNALRSRLTITTRIERIARTPFLRTCVRRSNVAFPAQWYPGDDRIALILLVVTAKDYVVRYFY
jgi:hypothetical protein